MMLPKPTRVRNGNYLDYIRGLPCLICRRGPSEPHHWAKAGHGGRGTKCDDKRAVNLCFEHHREIHDHGKKSFAMKYTIDVESVVEKLNNQWEALHAVA